MSSGSMNQVYVSALQKKNEIGLFNIFFERVLIINVQVLLKDINKINSQGILFSIYMFKVMENLIDKRKNKPNYVLKKQIQTPVFS